MISVKWTLTVISAILSVAMYIPLLRRILSRKSTGDFSKPFQLMILSVQANNLVLALLERAWYLAGIYVVHLGFVSTTTYLVYKYYDRRPQDDYDRDSGRNCWASPVLGRGEQRTSAKEA